MTKGKDEEPQPVAPRTPTVMWIHDGPVCVTVVDQPNYAPPPLNCQCQACGAARHAEWAERFLR